MTEYKKLVSLVETLKKDVDVLYTQRDLLAEPESADGEPRSSLPTNGGENTRLSVDALFTIVCQVKEAVVNGAPRVQKIVAKGRETDPNRQIYNEAMCAKIEDLFSAFADVVFRLLYETNLEPLRSADETTEHHDDSGEAVTVQAFPASGPPLVEDERLTHIKVAVLEGAELPLEEAAVLGEVEARHDAALLEQARAEAWAGRVAGDLVQLIAFEVQSRQILEVEEKQARFILTEAKRRDKKTLLDVLALIGRLQRDVEGARRAKERAWLAASRLAFEDIASLHSYLLARMPAREVRKAFAKHMCALCAALLTTPEDLNIRLLRCNNQNLIQDYGHCCLTKWTPPGVGNGTDPRPCDCTGVVEAAEVLWHLLGYVPQYTNKGSWSVPELLSSGGLQDARLPCGAFMSDHTFTPMGFEAYSERLFELKEPDPAQQSDVWMAWFDRVGKISALLASDVSSNS